MWKYKCELPEASPADDGRLRLPFGVRPDRL